MRRYTESRSRSRGTRTLKILNILILAIFIAVIIFKGTYSKYINTATGNATIDVAKWAVKIDNTNINSIASGALSVPLTYNSSSYTVANKLAPGGTATFTFVIDPTGSEVAIDYTIALGSVTGLTNNGSNIALTSATYTVQGGSAQNATITSGASTISFSEDLADVEANKTVTVVGTLTWTDDGTTNAADTANGYADPTPTANISITAAQHTNS